MKLLQTALEMIAPEECLVCQVEGSSLCANCSPRALVSRPAACVRCNAASKDGRTCSKCRRSTALAGASVSTYYDGAVKEVIRRFKYERNRMAGHFLAELMADSVIGRFDLVVPVPPAPARYRQRGFDHTGFLAAEVARSLRLPLYSVLLHAAPGRQVGLTRVQRLARAESSFHAIRPVIGDVLLVDDVVTTGATMSACAAALKSAGARSVWGVAAAKH